MKLGQRVTSTDLVAGLASLGVKPVAHAMVHTSLSRFGWVDGGAETLVAALLRSTGEGGAVIAPSFRDAIRSANYALCDCERACPGRLCPSRERGYTGVVGETIRADGEALRSCHPTHSWVGLGAGAAYLLEGHGASPTPCGRGSPFFRLMERDGVVLLLGIGLESLTAVHAVEDARNVPYLSALDPLRRHATYTTSGRRIQYRYPALLRGALESAGLLRAARIGAAECLAVGARDLGAFLWITTAHDPWCLVLRPARRVFDPQADATEKTARMARAWSARPDREAWRELLAASEREIEPVRFAPALRPREDCPAYRGRIREHHRCAANDLPPWEKFEDYPRDEPGVATCQHCNWPGENSIPAPSFS